MDKQTALYVTLNWIAVFFYVLATIANVWGIVFDRKKPESRSYWLAAAALVVHAAAIGHWWKIVGHGPYMAPSEVLSSDAWVTMAAFIVFIRKFPRIRPASILVFPATFLMLALANMYNPGIRSLPTTFGSVWLIFHISFYKISLATLVIACAFSVFVLLKARSHPPQWLNKLPDANSVDLYAYRFAGFGFIFWAIAMLAGSIWAYRSWGRYWGWDPVETWSLMTWLMFGVYLHLRHFFRWGGKRRRGCTWHASSCH
ncbi:cytochrome c biogenesis protein CcsA [Geobacter sp. OR-1]|uniref:cytochrome c biogenesis protein n=1 Tax=Geobacter sp. OR-1 TaxID=1266765 RepID=UPI000543F487|nr:cytochrome c biogenesis protein CcsA [Geobacter sp. OR-1]GAM07818.1 cytochrome c biogenesis protein CcsA [Geobacter sp. OR-1]